jgi:four helix bundle protein
MPRDFTRIKAWERADELCVQVYQGTKGFPREEIYGLTSQVRRAAVSVAANIAEGAGRQTKKDYLHFLYIARGSLAEVRYHLHLSQRLGFLGPAEHQRLDALRDEAGSTLHGLITAVEKEAGVLGRFTAVLTSGIILFLASKIGSHSV